MAQRPISRQSPSQNIKHIMKLFMKLLQSKINLKNNGLDGSQFLTTRTAMLWTAMEQVFNSQGLVIISSNDQYVLPSIAPQSTLTAWTASQRRQWMIVLKNRSKGVKDKEFYEEIEDLPSGVQGIIALFRTSPYGVIRDSFQLSLEGGFSMDPSFRFSGDESKNHCEIKENKKI